jgi:hypothetical protein
MSNSFKVLDGGNRPARDCITMAGIGESLTGYFLAEIFGPRSFVSSS